MTTLHTQPESQLLVGSEGLRAGLERFQSVLGELQSTHDRLEQRAKRVEAELEVSNQQLATKVAELDRTNQFLEAILSSLPTGVIVRDESGAIVRVNRACSTILDREDGDLLGTNAALPIERAPQVKNAPQGDRWSQLHTPSGTRKTVVLSQSEVHGSEGTRLGSVEILSDQTALARATHQVHQQAKMAALGTMAGGIAHEIRNPMNAVRGFAGLLVRPGVPEAKQKHYAQAIEKGVLEVEGTIKGLLNLANPEGPTLRTLQSAELFQSALDLVQAHEEAQGIEWTTQWQDVELKGDHIQLRQALRNLIANAVQAQKGEGPIQLLCDTNDGSICFEVHDSGPGLDVATSERCVDPFYTTRAEGMGLGLSLVDRIAQLHGGSLQVTDHPSSLGGACVRLSLPLS